MRTVAPGEIYRHFKGKLYQIIAVAYHSETNEKYVVYQALYGDFKTYIRPYDQFLGETDKEKYPEAAGKYRFERVDRRIDPPEEEKACTEKNDPDADIQPDFKETEKGVNPLLMEFFEQKTFREKSEYLGKIRNRLDDRLINDIAASLDLTVDEGDPDTRYASLLNCLKTMARFETGRLR